MDKAVGEFIKKAKQYSLTAEDKRSIKEAVLKHLKKTDKTRARQPGAGKNRTQ